MRLNLVVSFVEKVLRVRFPSETSTGVFPFFEKTNIGAINFWAIGYGSSGNITG